MLLECGPPESGITVIYGRVLIRNVIEGGAIGRRIRPTIAAGDLWLLPPIFGALTPHTILMSYLVATMT
jgi:hypothetical protein